MSVAASTVILALLSPSIWWVYEGIVVFCWFIGSFMRRWGKDLHLIGDFDKSGMFHELGHYYVDPLVQTFKARAGKWFYSEREKAGYIQSAIGGDRRVIFHSIKRARPREVEMKAPGTDGQIVVPPEDAAALAMNVKKGLKGSKDPEGKLVDKDDPGARDFGDFMRGEAKRQVGASEGAVSFGKAMLFIMLAVGIMAGVFICALYLTKGFTINPFQGAINCLPPASLGNINGTLVCR
jgi:hypothetical protein